MSLRPPLASDDHLARLLQIGVVLEEVAEARAAKHATESDDLDEQVRATLEGAAAESAVHRERLAELVEALDAETVGFDEVQQLVETRYEADDEFDGPLYDQLCSEETAYKFYDDLVTALETSAASFSVDRERVLDVLCEIRAEEAAGVEEITDLMEATR